MDNQIKNIFKYALVLFIITAVTASLLAWVNMVTADKIAQNAVLAENNALCEVMVNAESFEMLDEEIANGYGAQAVYVAKDATEKPIGLCVKMANNGYGGEIVSIIGVDLDAIVTGVSVISHSETPGLGAKLVKDDFKGQFIGKGEVSVVKAGAKNDQVNAISGATRSSKALAGSVNSAVSILKQIKGEGIYIQ